MSHETCTCELCREDYPLSDLITFHHHQLCPTCYEDETTLCHCAAGLAPLLEIAYSEVNCGKDWYVARDENATISGRIRLIGEVNLILCDGATLTAEKRIRTTDGTLNLYPGTTDSEVKGTGKLMARGDSGAAGIGGGSAQITPPTVKENSSTSITVNAAQGMEYSVDGQTWEISGTFTGLKADTEYTVLCRRAATDTADASPASPVLTVKTAKGSAYSALGPEDTPKKPQAPVNPVPVS